MLFKGFLVSPVSFLFLWFSISFKVVLRFSRFPFGFQDFSLVIYVYEPGPWIRTPPPPPPNGMSPPRGGGRGAGDVPTAIPTTATTITSTIELRKY